MINELPVSKGNFVIFDEDEYTDVFHCVECDKIFIDEMQSFNYKIHPKFKDYEFGELYIDLSESNNSGCICEDCFNYRFGKALEENDAEWFALNDMTDDYDNAMINRKKEK